ncbi:hypothetical protein glysoja_005696 [Glycine soja]|nr:hypothetical protein glysoja_005696 [Glycine soja]
MAKCFALHQLLPKLSLLIIESYKDAHKKGVQKCET